MPLLAFDDVGTRLGGGKGFYDRALAQVRNESAPKRLGFAFELQRLPGLARASWDVPLHAVVTERAARFFQNER